MKKEWGLIFMSFIVFSFCAMASSYDEALTFIEKRAQKVRKKRKRLMANRKARHHRPWFRNRPPYKHRTTYFLGNLGKDVLLIHRNIFSWDSFKILSITFPFFIGSRMIDEKLQNCFFDKEKKKNKNEPPKWCRELARWSIGVPAALLGTQAFLSRDEDFRTTSQVFLLGLPFVLLSKDLIKKLDFDLCKRPFHGKLAKDQRCFGGFPSGHVAEATYITVLYGMRYGPDLALPFGGIAVFVGAVFLTCNRHYLSQIVAGAGFGAMYAVAANKLIDSKCAQNKNVALNIAVNEQGGPSLSVSCRF